jgi:hypothetical protein
MFHRELQSVLFNKSLALQIEAANLAHLEFHIWCVERFDSRVLGTHRFLESPANANGMVETFNDRA